MKNIAQYKIDQYIAFAVGIQSLLVILQQILLDVLMMEEETATFFRVVLTAGTMIPAILFSAYRIPFLFAITYALVLLWLMLTILLHPENTEYIYGEATRFLLPVSIPCCLCLITIHDYNTFENVLYKISIATSILVIVYCSAFFLGVFYINNYNMSFGYGCLLPMALLYSKDSMSSKMLSFLILVVVIAIGSRGSAFVFVLYIIFETIFFERKKLPFLMVVGIVIMLALPLIIGFLDNVGIQSRTLSVLLDGGNMRSDSERTYMYNKLISHIDFWGYGVYGDRVILDGSYCHNFFIEVFYDFGIIGGFIICFMLLRWIVSVFLKTNKQNKKRILQIFMVVFAPMMVSHSFLKDYNFGLMLGVIILISREKLVNRIRSGYHNDANIIFCKKTR